MAYKIQTFGLLMGWWIWLVGYQPTFATTPCTDLAPKNDFFGKKEQSILHIGINSWAKLTKKTIDQHWAIGGEVAIGPVIEWHPLNGIGLQTGLCYSYNYLFTIDFSVDRKKLLDPSLSAFQCRFINEINALFAKAQGFSLHTALVTIQFHAISLPLFFRFYPSKSRKWVCYGGPRLIWILPFSTKQPYFPVDIDTAIIKDILYNTLMYGNDIANQRGLTVQDVEDIAKEGVLEIYHSMFKGYPNNTESQLLSNKLFDWHLVWNFGLAFKGASGWIIGIHDLGLMLGYDFVK